MHCDAQLASRLLRRSKSMAKEMAEAAATTGIPGPNLVEAGSSYAVFAGAGSPLTQGGGPLEEWELQQIQGFYRGRCRDWEAIVTPFTPLESVNRLLALGARVMQWESVLVREIAQPPPVPRIEGEIHEVSREDLASWSEVATRGFFGDQLDDTAQQLGRVMGVMPQTRRYLIVCNGEPAAAATLSVCEGLAFLGGAATLPRFRGRGFQSALIARRLFDASGIADLATMGALPGSVSQRNGERQGFRLAFTSLSLKVPVSD